MVQSSHRDTLQKTLGEAGIGTLIHYPIPPHLQQAYRKTGLFKGQFPIAERLASQVLSLPIGPQLDDANVKAVIAAINAAEKQ